MRAIIYDAAILKLTSAWYANVLDRLPHNARLLDVGIGTGGALAKNADKVRSKGIQVTGVDIDADYVQKARTRLDEAGLNQVDVRLQSIYDHQDGPYDGVYFSASFMLMPDPAAVLRHVSTLLGEGGQIYFTQTFQDRKSVMMEKAKPLLKKLTTIDFGTVTYENDFRSMLEQGGVNLLSLETMGRSGSRSYRVAVARPTV